jgi:phosphoribosylformylglycinamidine (FGAM) synthase-like enzyme
LSYTEIWISESQERMVLSVPKKKIGVLIELFSGEGVEATVIGEFVDTGSLELFYRGNKVCDLAMEFLHEGIPQVAKKAVFVQAPHPEPRHACPPDLTPALLKLLAHHDICSKEWIVRQYDHEVQGGSVVKPLCGIDNDGPSDASVVRPVLGSKKGIAVSNGINFRFGMIDPFWMAASCVDEAIRQIISVGGSRKELAVLDNFCWGNPDKPDRLGSLVRAAYGCSFASKAYGVPFISGKDSLYNEYAVHGKSVAIPGTLLISALCVMEDVSACVTMYAKRPKDLMYIVGQTYDELGGSHYFDLSGEIGNGVPQVIPQQACALFDALSEVSSKKMVRAMHDCSEGGIAVAAAEMAFSGGLGMDLFAAQIPYKNRGQSTGKKRNDYILFSESNSRIMVEVEPDQQKAFESLLRQARVPFGLIGCVNDSAVFRVRGIDGAPCIEAPVRALKKVWQEPLAW